MARNLSNILLKGLAGLPAARSSRIVSGSFYHQRSNFATTVPSDPDTHEDFQPTTKVESTGMSLKDIVEQDVKENPVMVYMKGVPDYPQCGFSAAVVRVLKHYNAPLSARNVVVDPDLKLAVKSFSNWPTFPQVFIRGEFVGGSDIIMDMHRSGELGKMLEDVAANQKSE